MVSGGVGSRGRGGRADEGGKVVVDDGGTVPGGGGGVGRRVREVVDDGGTVPGGVGSLGREVGMIEGGGIIEDADGGMVEGRDGAVDGGGSVDRGILVGKIGVSGGNDFKSGDLGVAGTDIDRRSGEEVKSGKMEGSGMEEVESVRGGSVTTCKSGFTFVFTSGGGDESSCNGLGWINREAAEDLMGSVLGTCGRGLGGCVAARRLGIAMA